MFTRRGKELAGFVVLNLVIAVGGYLSLSGIRVSQVPVFQSGDPTPLGYTRSLALFLIPCLVFGAWLVLGDRDAARRRAFFLTVAILFPIGAILDFLLGKSFFVFPNEGAVLGALYPFLRFPAYDWSHGWRGLVGPGWVPGYLPLEEFLFYALGFACILLTYIWCEAVLFADAKSDRSQPVPRLFLRAWSAAGACLAVGAGLFLVGYGVNRYLKPAGDGFPGYFLFLVVSALVPSMACFRVAFHFVHWRALTVAWLFVLSISQFWEASLALPYQWWDYRHPNMIGIVIRPHCDLPIEAAVVWSLASWTTVMVHETVLAWIRLRAGGGRGGLQVFRALSEDLEALKALEHRERTRSATTGAEQTEPRPSS